MKLYRTNLALLVAIVLFFGCARQYEENEFLSMSTEVLDLSVDKNVKSELEAIDLAARVIGSNVKATKAALNVAVDYILSNNARTRSTPNDTLAYVINVPDGGGFAIISRDNSEDDVIAFSHDGNFDLSSVEANWIVDNLLIPYFEKSKDVEITRSISKIVGGHTIYEGMELVGPKAGYGIHQQSPFNDMVNQYYPGCVVGCVPVAIATIAITAKNEISILGDRFYLESIRKGFFTHWGGIQRPDPFPVFPPITGVSNVVGYNPIYVYEQAVSETSRLLFRLGQALKTNYKACDETTSAPASSTTMPNTLAFLNQYEFKFSVPITYNRLDEQMIVNKLRDNSIFFMVGYDQNNESIAHAYVCDGCYYLSSPTDDSKIEKCYLHIDWGWKYDSSGYYSGKVWSAGGYDFVTYGLIGIEIEK